MKINFLQTLLCLACCFFLQKSTAQNPVVINELMASNIAAVRDEFNQFDDWIELYNRSTAAVNIGGWHLTDTATNITKWTFPANTTIPAGGYLIVWADEDSSQNSAGKYHANFKLSKSGESVRLSNASQVLQDLVAFGAQTDDRSFARIPNGTGSFRIGTHTFGANNSSTSSADLKNTPSPIKGAPWTALELSPNPARSSVRIEWDNNTTPQTVQIYNLIGRLVFQTTHQSPITVPVEDWAAGIYIVRVGRLTHKLVIR